MNRNKKEQKIKQILNSYSGTLARIDKRDETIIGFGIYKGQRMRDVPADYLIFLFDNNKCGGDVLKYIRLHETELRKEADRINGKK